MLDQILVFECKGKSILTINLAEANFRTEKQTKPWPVLYLSLQIIKRKFFYECFNRSERIV